MGKTASINTKLNFDDLSDDALIRQKDLIAYSVIPFSPATMRRKGKAHTFPEPKKISGNISVFRVSDLRQWLKAPANWKPSPTSEFNEAAITNKAPVSFTLTATSDTERLKLTEDFFSNAYECDAERYAAATKFLGKMVKAGFAVKYSETRGSPK